VLVNAFFTKKKLGELQKALFTPPFQKVNPTVFHPVGILWQYGSNHFVHIKTGQTVICFVHHLNDNFGFAFRWHNDPCISIHSIPTGSGFKTNNQFAASIYFRGRGFFFHTCHAREGGNPEIPTEKAGCPPSRA
jgi:hypothetical protein